MCSLTETNLVPTAASIVTLLPLLSSADGHHLTCLVHLSRRMNQFQRFGFRNAKGSNNCERLAANLALLLGCSVVTAKNEPVENVTTSLHVYTFQSTISFDGF